MPSDMYTQRSFYLRKIDKAFFMIAIDKPHNQNIAVIKAYRGTIGVNEDNYKAFFSLSSKTSQPIRRTSDGYLGYQVINWVS